MPGNIEIEQLRKVWPNGTVALDGVSLSVPPGQVVAILGGSGAGKSTFLRAAARLTECTSGTVRVGSWDMTAARGRVLAKARATIGFVFQQFNLIRSYTALENVLTARIAHTGYWRGLVGLFSPHDRALALKCLADVGMSEKAASQARELSGGQQQRVAIARAFAQEPSALFADEPTASLDPKLAETVLQLLHGYGKAHNVPVLINVHSVEQARRFADRAVGLRKGRIVYDALLTDGNALSEGDLETIYGSAEQDA